MRLNEFVALLKKDFTHPVYLVYGNEPILISRLLNALKNNVLGGVADDFTYALFWGSSSKGDAIVAEANQVPFLSGKRLIVVKETEKLNAEDQAALAEYCRNPSETTTLVFAAASIDKRTKLYKTLIKSAKVIELSTPPEEELRKWIGLRFKKEKKTLSAEALELLVAGGGSLTQLAQEVEKLLIYSEQEKHIQLEDVVRLTAGSKIKSVFDLWDAVASRKRNQAFQILRELQQERLTLPELIGLLRWQLSKLFQGEELMESGLLSKKEISSSLKIPFFVADKFIMQVRQFSKKRIWASYEAILKADEEVKTGSRQDKEILDILFYRLMA